MIYIVKKDEQEFEMDDNVLFDKQKKVFRDVFNELRNGDMAEFENVDVVVFPDTGRVIITKKMAEDGTI